MRFAIKSLWRFNVHKIAEAEIEVVGEVERVKSNSKEKFGMWPTQRRSGERKSAEASERGKRRFWQVAGREGEQRRRGIKGRTVRRRDDKNLKEWKRIKLWEKRQWRPDWETVPILFYRDIFFMWKGRILQFPIQCVVIYLSVCPKWKFSVYLVQGQPGYSYTGAERS